MNPVNPSNIANDFEKEALRYLEKNSDQKYYYKFNEDNKMFNFMGALKTQKACISCHPKYKIGDLRGGIHVGVPMNNYMQHVDQIEEKTDNISLIVIFTGLFVLVSFIGLLEYLDRRFEKEKSLSDDEYDRSSVAPAA